MHRIGLPLEIDRPGVGGRGEACPLKDGAIDLPDLGLPLIWLPPPTGVEPPVSTSVGLG